MTEVPDNVLFRHMTPEQKAIVLMWYALELPVEWRYQPHVEEGDFTWELEDDPYINVRKALQTNTESGGYLDCYYRLKSP